MNPAHRYISSAPSVLEFVAKISKYVEVTFKTNLGFLGGEKKRSTGNILTLAKEQNNDKLIT